MDIRAFQITPQELKRALESGTRLVLVDVREPEEQVLGVIDGSILIPLGEVPVRGPQELDPEADIVIYCAHGVRSLHALMALRARGFKKLRSLEGGIAAWQDLTR